MTTSPKADVAEIERGTCADCKFGVYRARTEYRDCPGIANEEAFVECHRYPPAHGRKSYGGRWRTTWPNDWCGEWAAITKETGDA